MYEIRPRFKAGESFYLEFYQDVSSVISEVGAPDVPTGIIRRYGMLVKTEAMSETGGLLSFTVDRVAHGKRSMSVKKDFDSDDPAQIDDIGMLETYTPLLGLAFKAKLDAQMHVVGLENVDLFQGKLGASNYGPIMQDAMRDFSEERLKMVWIEYPLAIYPNRAVKVGETWTNTVNENFPIGKVELPHECKLERVVEEGGQKLAKISFHGTMKRLEKGFAKVGNVQVTSYEFTFKGEATYDFGVGHIVSRLQNNRTTYQFPGKPAAAGDPPPMQNVRVVANQTYKLMSVEQRGAEKEKNKRESKGPAQPASGPAGG